MFEKKRDWGIFIDDILGSIEKIERYTEGKTFEGFSHNEIVIDAVIRNFEIIGEAARNIPEEIKGKYPFVEWKEMLGFRNVLIHDYFRIEVESVWDTVQNNIPILKKHVLELKSKHEQINP